MMISEMIVRLPPMSRSCHGGNREVDEGMQTWLSVITAYYPWCNCLLSVIMAQMFSVSM